MQYRPYPIQGNATHWTPDDKPGDYGDEYIYLINERGEIRWADSYADGVNSFADLKWRVGVDA